MVSFTNWRVKQRGSRFALESHPEVWEGREGRGYFWLSYTGGMCMSPIHWWFSGTSKLGKKSYTLVWTREKLQQEGLLLNYLAFSATALAIQRSRKHDGARRFTCPRFLQITLSSNFSFHNISFAKKLENEIQVKCLLIQLAIRGFPFALTTPHSRGSQSREIVA